MNKCRTCLTTPANNDITQLEKGIDEYNNTHCPDIMLFCLDIKVTQDCKITTKLCDDCYRKIISFYKFKTLSLKNDAYLKSLYSMLVANQKLPVCVDDNGLQHENLLDTEEYGPSLVECMLHAESSLVECILDAESDDEPLTGVNSDKNKDIKNLTSANTAADKKKNAKKGKTLPLYKRIGRPTKVKKKEIKNVIQGRQVCEECGVSVLDLKTHSLRHQPKDERAMLQCKACPKLFLTKGGRRRHYKTTHLGLKSKCDICNKEVIHLSTHKIQVHNPEAAPFGCHSCERRFVSQGALDLHLVTHTKDRDFECDICHEKFRSKGFVVRHIRRVHKKERNHQCEICSKAFFDKSLLLEHIGSHTTERQFLCTDCGKSFTTKDSLRKHRLVHNDVRKYSCELCNKSFKVHSYLRSHMLSHTKVKSHPCQYCGARFGRAYSRRLHELKHHTQTQNG